MRTTLMLHVVVLLTLLFGKSTSKNAASGKNYHKSTLKCRHDQFSVEIKPSFSKDVDIMKVTLRDDSCNLEYNGDFKEYSIKSLYTKCGTKMVEEKDHIVYKNVARIHYKNMTIQNELIQRTLSFNIGLECRMKRSSIHSIKGKREPEDGMIIGPQSVLINDYARGDGSFSVDFEVFKTSKYLESYGKEEFPINVEIDHRIFFEVSLNANRDLGLNLIPRDCFATRTRSFQGQERYYLIQNSCPKDATYKQHRYTRDVFQFSVQAFNFKDSNDGIYVHCESYVCKNTTDHACRFGCDKSKPMRNMKRRSVEIIETSNVEGVMTSTLEIRVSDPKFLQQLTNENAPKSSNKKSKIIKLLPYIQIPILLVLIIGVYVLWRYMCKRNNKKIYDGDKVLLQEQ